MICAGVDGAGKSLCLENCDFVQLLCEVQLHVSFLDLFLWGSSAWEDGSSCRAASGRFCTLITSGFLNYSYFKTADTQRCPSSLFHTEIFLSAHPHLQKPKPLYTFLFMFNPNFLWRNCHSFSPLLYKPDFLFSLSLCQRTSVKKQNHKVQGVQRTGRWGEA